MDQPEPLTKKDLIKKYILDYDWKPTDEQMDHFKAFCQSIALPEVLAQVLDPRNHRRSKSGQVWQPRVAELYDIRDRIVKGLWDKKRDNENRLQVKENDVIDNEVRACKYCVMGDVFDLVWLEGPSPRWGIELLGPCAKCANGSELPGEEIISLAKSLGANCRAVLWELMIFLLAFNLGHAQPVGRGGLEQAIISVTANFKRKRAERKRRQREVQETKGEEVPF